MSDEPVKIQMMFSIVDNQNDEVYVKYTVNKFITSNDWGFKQLIHKNAIIFQREKFIKPYGGGALLVRVKMRLDEHKHDYIKKLNENLHYCKLLSENFSQYYYNSPCDTTTNITTSNELVVSSQTATNSTSPSSSTTSSSSTPSSSSTTSSKPECKPSTLACLSSSINNAYYDLILLVKPSTESSLSTEIVHASDSSGQKRPLESPSTPVSKKSRVESDCLITSKMSDEEDEYVELRAHKCILAARSPVFKAMFNYRLKENLTNRVIIDDFRADVVKAMLKYIYTAFLPDDVLRPVAVDLYIAAEKYFIESLKIKCREFLVEHLSLDNVVQAYILAELYEDSMLRKQALKYINENIDKVTQNNDWKEFMAVYPQLFSQAFIRICKKDF